MKNVMMGVYTRGEELIDFNFGTDLSAFNKQKFVNSVVNLIVDEKTYNSVLRDLVFDFYVINMLTDVDIDGLEEDSFVDSVEKFLEETNIVDIVKANAVPTLFDELNNAVDKSIEYLTGIHSSPLNEALASLVNVLEKKVNEVDLASAMGMAKKFAEMTGKLTEEGIVNAYINSDMYKKNLDEIAESKVEKAVIVEALDEAVKAIGEK